jgi:hypothetical protein
VAIHLIFGVYHDYGGGGMGADLSIRKDLFAMVMELRRRLRTPDTVVRTPEQRLFSQPTPAEREKPAPPAARKCVWSGDHRQADGGGAASLLPSLKIMPKTAEPLRHSKHTSSEEGLGTSVTRAKPPGRAGRARCARAT